MTTLLRRLAAPAAGLLLLVAVGMTAFDAQAQDSDMEDAGNAPVAKNLDEAAMQIQRLRHQMRRLERQLNQLQQNLAGTMAMMGQMPTMGQGMGQDMMGQGMMGAPSQTYMPGQMPMIGIPGQMPMMGQGGMAMMDQGMMSQMPMMGQMPMCGMGMMGQMPMMGHDMMGHDMMGQGMMGQGMMGQGMMGQGMGMSSDPATRAFQEAGYRMHHAMKVALTGDADRDFVASMIPHHQGAIDMAEIILKHGDDPEIKKLAEAIIAAQKAEIAQMQEWLKQHPQ